MHRKQQDAINLKAIDAEAPELEALVDAIESPKSAAKGHFVASGTAKCEKKPVE